MSDRWLLNWRIPSCVKYRWLLYWWIPSLSDHWLLYWWTPPTPTPFVLDRCMHGYVTDEFPLPVSDIVGYFTDESPTPPQGIYRWLLYWLISFCLRSLVPLLMNSLQCKISLVTLQMNPPPPRHLSLITVLMNSLLCQILGSFTDEFPPVSDIVGYFTDEFPPVSDIVGYFTDESPQGIYHWLLYLWHLSLITPPLSYQIFSYFTEELVTWSYLLLFFF